MYRAIKIYLNGEYIATTRAYASQKALKARIRSDKRIFVAGIPDKVYDVCDYDKLHTEYAD